MKLEVNQKELVKETLKNRPKIVKDYIKPDNRSYVQLINTVIPLGI